MSLLTREFEVALICIIFCANGYDYASYRLHLSRTNGGNRVSFVHRALFGTTPTFNAPIELFAHNDGILGLQRVKSLLLAWHYISNL